MQFRARERFIKIILSRQAHSRVTHSNEKRARIVIARGLLAAQSVRIARVKN